MQGLEDTLYAEEQFQLQFKFGSIEPATLIYSNQF